ncbi:hypothetical protein B0H65DRAFT_44536 [Neurospora tetraspora]|uniref:Uncharacterized protein n=1 Tax=Neurospora tetraspora TaxID=94610 RepID=A0AAE0JQU5_9PEZI|nr:hypothetical protein B0H65DRAFT_44536 [Neurospora tetraspora]
MQQISYSSSAEVACFSLRSWNLESSFAKEGREAGEREDHPRIPRKMRRHYNLSSNAAHLVSLSAHFPPAGILYHLPILFSPIVYLSQELGLVPSRFVNFLFLFTFCRLYNISFLDI